jgi:hypothetical protein
MKRLTWISLVITSLALIAAQCSVSQTATEPGQAETATINEEPTTQIAEPEESGSNDRGPTDTPMQAPTATPKPEPTATSEPEEQVVESTVETEESNEHDANCEDPFAGVSVRFQPQHWTSTGLDNFTRDEILDPNSNLSTNFCLHSVDYEDIISGGVPPDAIPPIDNPVFDSLDAGDEWLADVQPVIALVVDGEARAYPLAILTRHEIVNDEIAGRPVAVTFCPLCNAGIVFDREVDGDVLRFGVSGNLRNSDLIMWDNKTLSWWQQFTGEAIVGEMVGTQLEMIPAQMVAWKDFKAAYPDGTVLSRNARSYGNNPYVNYDSQTQPFLYLEAPDPRLKAMERVLGYHSGETATAYPLSILSEKGVIADTIDGQDVVVFYEPGQASALDQASIELSREVGSAGLFIPEVDGQKLTFSYSKGVITDNETGSEWDVFGRAINDELEGAQLEPLLSHTHFWFAWAAFRPDTTIYGKS